MDTVKTVETPNLGFVDEFSLYWRQLPNKTLFFSLLAAWALLFQFLGNGTFGYIDTTSLFSWMWNAYYPQNMTSEDSHGGLIPLVVLALFWMKRKELVSARLHTWGPGLLILALALLLHVFGYMAQQPRVSIVALFVGLYGLMGLAWGPAWLKRSLFPFFLFGFCVPLAALGESVTFPLRHFVSKIVAFLCNGILGMDVIREGTQLFNSAHTYRYEVAAACSGLRSLVAIFALNTIFAFLNFKTWWARGALILAAFPLAVIGNVIRMMCIIMAADISGQSAGNFVHENWFFSLLPYVPAILGIYYFGRLLERWEGSTQTTIASAAPAQ